MQSVDVAPRYITRPFIQKTKIYEMFVMINEETKFVKKYSIPGSLRMFYEYILCIKKQSNG